MACHRSIQAVTAALPLSRVRHILSAKQPTSHLTSICARWHATIFKHWLLRCLFSSYVILESAYWIYQPQSKENKASRTVAAALKIDTASKKSNKNVLQLTCRDNSWPTCRSASFELEGQGKGSMIASHQRKRLACVSRFSLHQIHPLSQRCVVWFQCERIRKAHNQDRSLR